VSTLELLFHQCLNFRRLSDSSQATVIPGSHSMIRNLAIMDQLIMDQRNEM
jgi:hypothetical protein